MTGRWLTLNAAAERIAAKVGRRVSMNEVLALGDSGRLTVRSLHDHYSVLEESVTTYLERSGIPVGEGPEIGDYAEHEFRNSQADYTDDTPNDEGDEQ